MTPLSLLLPLLASPALAAEDDYEFSLEGFYRVRGHAFNNLYTDAPNGRYLTHKLRLQPEIDFEEGRAKFIMMADALTDVVWGDNMSYASTALFAGAPSDTHVSGVEGENFKVKRAWMEFNAAVASIRLGRQPSHWGMGLLANDGNGFDDTFGENKYGNTFDRFLLATRPVAVAQTALGRPVSPLPLYAGFGIDRLVEDPLIQYYGYECDPEDPADSPYCAPDDDHGYTEDRDAATRDDQWWTQHGDDVLEFIYLLIYKGEDLSWPGSAADLTLGAYGVNRIQKESNSEVWIVDAYIKMNYAGILLEAEGLTIRGETEAIALPGSYDPSKEDSGEEGPLYKFADIWGGVVRAGYEQPAFTVMAEAGYASGDDNVADEEFTGRPIHADHNVGLLLYEEILGRVTAYRWSTAGEGLWSNGGVYNSKYIFPNVRWRPVNNLELIGAYLVAWPDKPDGAIIITDEDAESPILGTEIDLAAKLRWQNHILVSLETGIASVTDRLPVEELGLTVDGKAWTVQSRVAYEF